MLNSVFICTIPSCCVDSVQGMSMSGGRLAAGSLLLPQSSFLGPHLKLALENGFVFLPFKIKFYLQSLYKNEGFLHVTTHKRLLGYQVKIKDFYYSMSSFLWYNKQSSSGQTYKEHNTQREKHHLNRSSPLQLNDLPRIWFCWTSSINTSSGPN